MSSPAVERAVQILVSAGMIVRYVTRYGHSTYLGWPGRSGVLRVSDHPQSSQQRSSDHGRVLARVTLHGLSTPDSDEALRRRVAEALGLYMIKSAQEPNEPDRGG